MEDFLASGKNEAMIALPDSLQKANGEILKTFICICVDSTSYKIF